MKNDIFQPARSSWEEYASKIGLQSVLDPNDSTGIKNQYIDEIHKKAITRVARLSPDSVILDFGCGIGRITKYLADRSAHIIGVDITHEMLVKARNEAGNFNTNFLRIDGQNLPIAANSVDLVVAVYVLQYGIMQCRVYQKILQEFTRVLKSKGRLLMIEQASICGQKSGSVRKPIRLEAYLDFGHTVKYRLLNKCAIRLGKPRRLEQFTVLRRWFPSWLHPLGIRAILTRNMSLKKVSLIKQPYVDYLLYLEKRDAL